METTNPPRSRPENHRWWTFVVLLLALVLARGLVLLATIPPFEGWDEYQHVAVIDHVVEHGQMPILDQSNIDPEFLQAVIDFPQPNHSVEQLGPVGAMDYFTFARAEGLARPAIPLEDPRWQGVRLYQAQHGPLYYHAMAPIYQGLGGRSHLARAVAGLRLVNLLLIVLAVGVVLAVVGHLIHDRSARVLIGLAVAVQPLFLINAIRVANDALGVALATMAIGCLMCLSPKRFVLLSAVAGLLIGSAFLAKSVHLGMIPFAGFVGILAMWRYRRHMSWQRCLIGILAMAGTCLAILGPNVVDNYQQYGGLTPMQEAVHNHKEGRTTSDLLQAVTEVDWIQRYEELWLQETLEMGAWSFLRPSRRWIERHEATMLLCLAGFLAAGLLGLVRRVAQRHSSRFFIDQKGIPGWIPLTALSLCLSYSAALSVHVAHSQLAWGRPTTNAWYAAACFPWMAVLVVSGGLAWPWKRLRIVLPFAWIGTMIIGEAMTVVGLMPSVYSGAGMGLQTYRQIAIYQADWLQYPIAPILVICTLTLLSLALGKTLWLAWPRKTFIPSEPRGDSRNDRRIDQPHQSLIPTGREDESVPGKWNSKSQVASG